MQLEKALEKKLERLPEEERRPRQELISGLAEFVVSVDSSGRLGRLAEALETMPKVGEEGVPRARTAGPRPPEGGFLEGW